MKFATALDMALHVAALPAGGYNVEQNAAQQRLRSSPEVRAWARARGSLSAQPHFRRYRTSPGFAEYDAAAFAINAGRGTPRDHTLHAGLLAETRNSQLIAPVGQVLFHGCADRDLDTVSPHPAAVSTSLDPTVARWHADAFAHRLGTAPIIYVVELSRPIAVLFGHTSQSVEIEALLPPGLTFIVRGVHPGRITVIEVDAA